MESRPPLRTCIGCRRKQEQGHLLRVSRNESGELALTQDKNRTGRGAYICPRPECIEAALKGDRLGRTLRNPVRTEEKDALKRQLAEASQS
jgi:predicted RNA-binding protein YlxR (DUF448 family)